MQQLKSQFSLSYLLRETPEAGLDDSTTDGLEVIDNCLEAA